MAVFTTRSNPMRFPTTEESLRDLALFLLKFVREKKTSQRYPRDTETVENVNACDADPQCIRYDRVEPLINKLGLAQTVKFIPKKKSDHEKILPTFSVEKEDWIQFEQDRPTPRQPIPNRTSRRSGLRNKGSLPSKDSNFFPSTTEPKIFAHPGRKLEQDFDYASAKERSRSNSRASSTNSSRKGKKMLAPGGGRTTTRDVDRKLPDSRNFVYLTSGKKIDSKVLRSSRKNADGTDASAYQKKTISDKVNISAEHDTRKLAEALLLAEVDKANEGFPSKKKVETTDTNSVVF